MTVKTVEPKTKLVKQAHFNRPDWDYFMLEPPKEIREKLLIPPVFSKVSAKATTKVITLLPKTSVNPHTGIGFPMVNIDGFRTINAYVICDPLNSSTQRGFTLELSFSLNPFVYGVGTIGETSSFFNFDSYFEPTTLSHRTLRCETSDLTVAGNLPWIGGTDLSHILRAPVMGPYVRASVFNEGNTARNVSVSAYLST